MADLKYYDVILRPLVTEQSMAQMGNRKYAFFVHVEANKSQIREAVEKMFDGVSVEKVNTLNCPTKKKRTRTYKYGRTAERKKAIVTLTPESKEIEIFHGM
jgi:large subunit ribosomal protein L23